MDEEFLDGVRQWLEKSGHAFELRTARAFREGGAKPVTLSFSYTDPSSGALCEGDVLAQFAWTALNDTPATIEVVVECKSGRDQVVGQFEPGEHMRQRWIGPGSALAKPFASVSLVKGPCQVPLSACVSVSRIPVPSLQ